MRGRKQRPTDWNKIAESGATDIPAWLLIPGTILLAGVGIGILLLAKHLFPDADPKNLRFMVVIFIASVVAVGRLFINPSEHSATTKRVYGTNDLLDAVLKKDDFLVRTALQEHPEYINTAYAQNGNTPLHVAALNGQTEIVKLLLEQPGLDTTLKNNDGKTARDLAQEKNFTEIVNLLRN